MLQIVGLSMDRRKKKEKTTHTRLYGVPPIFPEAKAEYDPRGTSRDTHQPVVYKNNCIKLVNFTTLRLSITVTVNKTKKIHVLSHILSFCTLALSSNRKRKKIKINKSALPNEALIFF